MTPSCPDLVEAEIASRPQNRLNSAIERRGTELFAENDFDGTPPLTLGKAYAGWASLFASSSGGSGTTHAAFYANAKLSTMDFGADFSVLVLFAQNQVIRITFKPPL